MNNIQQNLMQDSILLIILIVSILGFISTFPTLKKQYKRHKSFFKYAPTNKKYIAYLSLALIVGILAYSSREYKTPPSEELAIVIGNTKNTPAPKISGEIQDAVIDTLLMNKGLEAIDFQEKIKIFSATKNPYLIELNYKELGLQSIGNNPSNAKRNAQYNTKIISDYISKQQPKTNGANYLGAVLEAKDNIKKGSKIIVIGSGLSDSGDLNFAKTSILTNKDLRNGAIKAIGNKYDTPELEGYIVEFYGLGNTSPPQEALSTKQKDIVRNTYSTIIKNLGGIPIIKTGSLTGDPVITDYTINDTDTGCGDLGYTFNEGDNIKFNPNLSTFVNTDAANQTLYVIKNMWDQYSTVIQSIKVDGYIFRAPGADVNSTLSQERAEAVKGKLVELGIPEAKITATGKGFGPYNKEPDDRMVMIKIIRSNDDCEEK